jgi:hypothetical protein
MTENVEETLRNVLNMMEQAGFRIDQDVKVIVDRELPFMGYTSRRWGSHAIVVSGFAVDSPMLEGLRRTTTTPVCNSLVISSWAGSKKSPQQAEWVERINGSMHPYCSTTHSQSATWRGIK